MNRPRITAIIYALLAAVFYALNAPASKVLLEKIPPTMMAGFLYLGAGIGIGILSLIRREDSHGQDRLTRSDLPYVIGMVVLDIAAPVLLMYGLLYTNAANASLLNNFEIVATTVIALLIFGEKVTGRLWIGILFITVSSVLLSCESAEGLHFSWGSLLVLAATVCWGFENNCTRKISSRSTYEIVFIKGIFSGAGALALGLITGERCSDAAGILRAMILGFVAYGLSIFFYIRAQSVIGAARTSAYYAVAPFIGAFISFVFLRESLSGNFAVALILMIIGTAIVVADTLILNHAHTHTHVFTHTHDGSTHTHVIEHSHEHTHIGTGEEHHHTHADMNPHGGAIK